MRFHFQSRRGHERGYVLLTLMLFVALLAVASMAWIEKIDFQIKRDREEELIHRGVQYTRAVRRYMKKLGRYPSRIEDLESTNNIRFIRKRYKDPITGKDFKPLHMTDVQFSFSPGAPSGLPPGADANAASQQAGAPGALNSRAPATGGPGPSSIPSDGQTGGADDTSQGDQSAQNTTATPNSPRGLGQGPSPATQSGPGSADQTYGGTGIMGVASRSKEKTIREFNKKDHYNQWQFIYDPTTDRGGLLSTPNQPPLQVAVQPNQQQNGQAASTGQSQGFGQAGMNPAPQQQPQSNPQSPDQQ